MPKRQLRFTCLLQLSGRFNVSKNPILVNNAQSEGATFTLDNYTSRVPFFNATYIVNL